MSEVTPSGRGARARPGAKARPTSRRDVQSGEAKPRPGRSSASRGGGSPRSARGAQLGPTRRCAQAPRDRSRTRPAPARRPSTRATSARRPARTHKRVVVMVAIAALALSGLAARLVQIQGVDASHYASYGSQEVYEKVPLPALRGAIYDRDGNLLAASAARVDVVADDYLVTKPGRELGRLAAILHMSESELRTKLSQRSGYVPLAYQVGGAVEQKVAALDLPYLSYTPDVSRVDPDGELFSPVLGVVGFAGRALSGLEYTENSQLAGSPGSEVVPTGPTGEGLPGSPTAVTTARQGTSLVLSLDEPLQIRGHDCARQRRSRPLMRPVGWRSSRTVAQAGSSPWSISTSCTARSSRPSRTRP